MNLQISIIARLTERSMPVQRDRFYSTVMDEIILELGYRVWLKAESAGGASE